MTSRGRFIVVEGLEGAGKSTAINTIISALKLAGIEQVITTREPGGTKIAEVIRSVLKGEVCDEFIYCESELLLFYAARTQLINQVIIPKLEAGAWVIADRFELSTYAYQGAGRGVDINFINKLSKFCLKGFTPDLTIYLDILPELGIKRVENRGKKDRIEQESMSFFNKIRDYFIKEVEQSLSGVIIDAAQPLESVAKSVEDCVCQFVSRVKVGNE
jgi:dTMP kinase